MPRPLPHPFVRPLPRPFVRSAAVLLSGAVLMGCGGDSTGPTGFPGFGSFTAQVTGSITRTLSGTAVFGGDVLGVEGFVVSLEPVAGDASIGIVKTSSGRPAVGTYVIGEFESALYVEFIVDGPGNQHTFYMSTTGQLQITTSTSTALAGTATFTAQNEFGPGQVQVAASFNATCLVGGPFTCD
jgi:hypothetical protein